jgi:SAM-dependent methyltransferase
MIQEAELIDRQRCENAHHAERAKEMQHIAETRVALDIIVRPEERGWNAHWLPYSVVKRLAITGMRALVVGCGFGGDAVLLTHLGFEVYAFDLSSDSLDIAMCSSFLGHRDRFSTSRFAEARLRRRSFQLHRSAGRDCHRTRDLHPQSPGPDEELTSDLCKIEGHHCTENRDFSGCRHAQIFSILW